MCWGSEFKISGGGSNETVWKLPKKPWPYAIAVLIAVFVAFVTWWTLAAMAVVTTTTMVVTMLLTMVAMLLMARILLRRFRLLRLRLRHLLPGKKPVNTGGKKRGLFEPLF